jgi:hypothetical protein
LGYEIKANETGGACGSYGGGEKCMQDLMGKFEGRRPFGRPRSRWEYNIKMNLKQDGERGLD